MIKGKLRSDLMRDWSINNTHKHLSALENTVVCMHLFDCPILHPIFRTDFHIGTMFRSFWKSKYSWSKKIVRVLLNNLSIKDCLCPEIQTSSYPNPPTSIRMLFKIVKSVQKIRHSLSRACTTTSAPMCCNNVQRVEKTAFGASAKKWPQAVFLYTN